MTLVVKTNKSAWTLEKKKKKRRPAPKSRACRTVQNEDEWIVTDKGLYVPYEQNFATEKTLYFCLKQQSIINMPQRKS